MLNTIMKKMRTHLLDEEEGVVEAVEGEGVEVHVEMDTWSMLMVDGRMSMLLPMQAMGMLTMVLLMRVMGMCVVEAVAVSGAVAGEVAMVVSLIISMMEAIMTTHHRHPEVGAVVSGAVAGEAVTVVASLVTVADSLIISKTEEGITRRHLFLHQLEVVVEAVAVGEAAQLVAEGVVATPMATWCTPLLRAHRQSAAGCRR